MNLRDIIGAKKQSDFEAHRDYSEALKERGHRVGRVLTAFRRRRQVKEQLTSMLAKVYELHSERQASTEDSELLTQTVLTKFGNLQIGDKLKFPNHRDTDQFEEYPGVILYGPFGPESNQVARQQVIGASLNENGKWTIDRWYDGDYIGTPAGVEGLDKSSSRDKLLLLEALQDAGYGPQQASQEQEIAA